MRDHAASLLAAIASLCLCAAALAGGTPVGTSFTYQGQLKSAGAGFNGAADLQFTLYDGPGGAATPIGSPVTQLGVTVVEGVFSVSLDFGAVAFNGEERWLAIGVTAPGNGGLGPYTPLLPRQRLDAAPYALHALNTPFSFNGSNAVFTGGNVGIGTSSPQATLHVSNPGALGVAVMGEMTHLSPIPATSVAVYGANHSTTGIGIGVVGTQDGSGWGVNGFAPAGYGVIGSTDSGAGVVGTCGASGFAGLFQGRGYFTGNLGAGVTAPLYPVHALSTVMASAVYGETNAGTSFEAGVLGRSTGASGNGVLGIADNGSGAAGVIGISSSGVGVWGQSTAPSGFAGYFPIGKSYFAGPVGIGTTTPAHALHVTTSGARAIFAEATASGGVTYGGYFTSAAFSGRGVFAQATHPTGECYGVWAENSSTNGRALNGWATAATGFTFGVNARSSSSDGRGVFGWASSTTGATYGGLFENSSVSGTGVTGRALAATGTTSGVAGETNSPDGRGVLGTHLANTGTAPGVAGITNSTTPSVVGVHGLVDLTAPGGLSSGVRGENRGTGGSGIGVFGSHAGAGWGVYGETPTGTGVRGLATSGAGGGIGVFGDTNSPNGYAGYFDDRTFIRGNLGIGPTMQNPTFLLQLDTNSAAKPTSNTWTISSDARLKKNIHTIDHALDDMLALRGVTYQWIDPASQGGMTATYSGMIAQEVERVFPEWVGEDARGYKTLTVIGFEGIVVEALRELRTEKDAEIAALNARLAELERTVRELRESRR